MRTNDNYYLNVNVPRITPQQEEKIAGASTRICRAKQPRIKTWQLYFASLLAVGFFAFVPSTTAKGSSGGHMSGMGAHGNGGHGHCRYADPLWFPYHGGIYDTTYSYTPTAKQQAAAKQQVEAYLAAVQKRRKHAPAHRYISVETLRPTKQQVDDYTKKTQGARRVEPSQLRCLMVFDTQTKEFVGSGCYVVASQPLIGEVTRFESVSAEFVGHETL